MWVTALWVTLGSAIGGGGRFLLSGWVARHIGETFPAGTLVVNVLGSLAIGVLFTLTDVDGRLFLPADQRQFLLLGLCGGFTTFSSFSLQALQLMQDDEYLLAGTYILGSVLLCLIAVWLGHVLAAAATR